MFSSVGRTSGGKLHLVPDVGKIPLADAVLIEDPTENGVIDDNGNIICSFFIDRGFKIPSGHIYGLKCKR